MVSSGGTSIISKPSEIGNGALLAMIILSIWMQKFPIFPNAFDYLVIHLKSALRSLKNSTLLVHL